MAKDDLKCEIFNMFTENKYLTAKDIEKKLNQPDGYVKDVLKDICDYIASGSNKGFYKLKSQYVQNENNDDEISLDE